MPRKTESSDSVLLRENLSQKNFYNDVSNATTQHNIRRYGRHVATIAF